MKYRFFVTIMILMVGNALGQNVTRTLKLVNTSANSIIVQPPSSVTNYSLTLPGAVSGTGSMLYTSNSTGTLSWLSSSTNGYMLELSGGIPTWQDPVTILQPNFVRYNSLGPQNTATTAGGNYLFNVEYGTTNAAAAAGARINSVTSLANSSATGLTLASTATGTGTATGLAVTVAGGSLQYAGTFNGGNVGVGTAAPSHIFEVDQTYSPATETGYIMSREQMVLTPSIALSSSTSEIIAKRTITSVVATSPISGNVTIRGGDFGSMQNASSTAVITGLEGARGYVNNANATQAVTNCSGFDGYVEIHGPVTTGNSLIATSLFLAGTITNYRGLYVTSPGANAPGTVTNATGILIDPYTNATGTNTAFLYNSTTSPVTITGSGHLGVGLNSTAPSTTTDFDGAIVTRPPSTINVGAAGNITVGDRSYIRVNPTASVNVGLTAGTTIGQRLVVEVLSNGANTLTFLDAVAQNENLQGNFAVPATGGLLNLIWNGTLWMELSRSTP